MMDYCYSWLHSKIGTTNEKEEVAIALKELLRFVFSLRTIRNTEFLLNYRQHLVECMMLHLTEEILGEWLNDTDSYSMKIKILDYFFRISPKFKELALVVMSKLPPKELIALWGNSRSLVPKRGKEYTDLQELILPLTPKKFQLKVHAGIIRNVGP